VTKDVESLWCKNFTSIKKEKDAYKIHDFHR
jgi:hypothetical protein